MSICFAASSAEFDKYVAANKYLVVNFTAVWCGPCQAIKPVADQFYADASGKFQGIEMIRVDLDSQQQLALRFKVTSVPTFVFLKSGKEVSRVTGANVQELIKQLEALNVDAAVDGKRNGTGSDAGTPKNSALELEISSFLLPGYSVLNDAIHFGEFESLNAQPLFDGETKDLLRVSGNNSQLTVYSDADSQILLYVPFMNLTKVYSVLIKLASNVENGKLDDEELKETQRPSVLKLWVNRPGIMTFDDASHNSTAAHVEQLGKPDANGWIEAKLKYVRFQNVQLLNMFIEGDEDEDWHTLVERIVIVGVTGESKDQGKIGQLDED